MFHACINLRSGYGKELYVPKGTITVRDNDLYLYVPKGIITVRDNDLYLYVPEGTITERDSDLYLYDPNGAAIMIQTESMSSTQTGP